MIELLAFLPEDTRWFCTDDQFSDKIYTLGLDTKTILALVQNAIACERNYWDSNSIRDFILALLS